MPTVVNGIGTWYYGKRRIHSRKGTCPFCGSLAALESYDTTLFIVVLFVPVIPLTRKRILEQCAICQKHRVISLQKWEEVKAKDGTVVSAQGVQRSLTCRTTPFTLRDMTRTLFATLTLAVLLPAAGALIAGRHDAKAPDVTPEAIKKWIDQLGDDDFHKREQATDRLAKLGVRALEALRRAARSHADTEVKSRAAELVRGIDKELRGELLVFGGGGGYWLNRVAFTPDGKHAVATGGAVILYDLTTGKEVHRCLELMFARPALALTRDGKHFLTGHQHDRVLRMGEVQTGKPVRTFEGHSDGMFAVAIAPDESRIVSGGLDKTLRLWDFKTGKELRQFTPIKDAIRSVDFSPDGKQVVSGHAGDGKAYLVRLWDAGTGKEVRSFQGHTREVTAVLFTPDGKSIFSAAMDGAAILWQAATGKELRRMTHTGGVYGAALSPDGKRALTAGFGDRIVRLWDLATAKEIRHFEGHIGAVLGVAFSRDGQRALSSDSNYQVRLWRLPK